MESHELEDLYRSYFPIIREKCTRMLGDREEAQDVAQETFTRLWTKRRSLELESPAVMTAWIYRTSTRLAIDRIRHLRLAPLAQQSDDEEAAPGNGGKRNDPERQAATLQMLERIAQRSGSRELQALILSRCDDLSQEEIARVMKTSDRTVRRLLVKAERRVQAWAGGAA